jgi:Mg2+ and Co2+ transporter CorA
MKQIIKQKASDNTYYHQDFHIALNYGINYLHENFGREAVREYLAQFANAYFAPLKKELRDKGLPVLKEHYKKIYKIENAVFDMSISPHDLLIHLFESPAVMYIKTNGLPVSSLYQETVITVNKEICRNTIYDCELIEYKPENGAYQLRFFKRKI